MKQLSGKWAFVTGSSRGIGKQIAMGLADHGCNVIVHGRDMENTESTVAAVRKLGVEVRAVAGELSWDESVQEVIRDVLALSVPVDILYNNAAIQNTFEEIWSIGIEEWKLSFQVNLYAPVAFCTAFAPRMKERGFGRIVNLTSGIKDVPQLAPYSASKAAIDKYSRDLAADLSGTNVLVNYLDPGWLKTDMGGPNAMFGVEDVLPGALAPALLADNGPTGQFFSAQAARGR